MAGRANIPVLGRSVLYLICGLIFIYLMFPILIVIPIAFSSSSFLEFPPRGISLRWFSSFFSRPEWTSAALLSVRVACLTTLFSCILGIPASFALARSRFRGKDWIYGFIISPMIVPFIVTGVAIYFVYSKLNLIGWTLGLVFAHSTLAIPKVIIIMVATLQTFDQTLEKASMNLGASPLRTFLKVTLPIIRPGVISAALFSFVTSFDELIITMFICGTQAVTLPKRMWDGVRLEIDPTIAAVSTILIVASATILLLAEFYRRRQAKPA